MAYVPKKLNITEGGTGQITLTSHGVLYGNGTSGIGATAEGATGTVLIGNTGGAPSFSALSGISVTSIAGTANQITASASTGAVTLSIPSAFTAPGSVTTTTSLVSGTTLASGTTLVVGTTLTATGGLTTLADLTQNGTTLINIGNSSATSIGNPTGGVGIGGGVLITNNLFYELRTAGNLQTQSGNAENGLLVETSFSPVAGLTDAAGLHVHTSFIAPTLITITNAYGERINPVYSSNVGTITNAYGLYYSGGSSSTGTLTNNYGMRVIVPAAGTNKYTAWFDAGVGIGAANLSSATNALLVTGALGCTAALNACSSSGIATIGSTTALTVSAAGLLNVANATDTSSGSTGAINTLGGLGVTKQIYCGTGLTVFSGSTTLAATTATTLGVGAALVSPAVFSVTGTTAHNSRFTGTQTTQSGNNQYSIVVDSNFQPAATLSGQANGVACFPLFTPTSGNITAAQSGYFDYGIGGSGTISAIYGLYVDDGYGSGPTVTTAYGMRVLVPSVGTTKYTAWFDEGFAIGSAANAFVTTGNAFLLTSTSARAMRVNGLMATDSVGNGTGTIRGIDFQNTFQPASGAATVGALVVGAAYVSPNGQTITAANGVWVSPFMSNNVGTIATMRGIYYDGGSGGAGTITTSYGLYVNVPAHGTTKYTSYFDNVVCIGGLSTTFALFVSTDNAGKPGVGGVWTNSSDERIKKNIIDCDDAISKLSQLRVREFEYKEEVCDHIKVSRGSKHYGFLAHEYEQVFPEDVVCGNEKFGDLEVSDCKAINTGQTSALVIRAIQQLEERIKILENAAK